MTSKIDFLARPIYPEASHHKPQVSPKYCLRQCPSGFWYMIPFIYEWGFEQMCKEWVREHTREGFLLTKIMPKPGYAKSIDLKHLVFEKPEELLPDA